MIGRLTIGLLIFLTLTSVQATILSFFAEEVEDPGQDFLELTVTVSEHHESLQQALAEAKEKAEKIKELEE